MWERELKLGCMAEIHEVGKSLPMWERELKHNQIKAGKIPVTIAPYVGA